MGDWGGGFLNKNNGFGGVESMKDEDFDEEDVWGVAIERDYSSLSKTSASNDESSNSGSSSSSSAAWHLTTSPRNILDAKVVQGGSSAPMVVPDWSKIYGKKDAGSVGGEGVRNKGDCGYYGDHYHDDYGDDDDDENDDEDVMIPPHEWIARKLARSKISSFSVCEGIGRTLKGRDLSKVRNAILTKTGFIE